MDGFEEQTSEAPNPNDVKYQASVISVLSDQSFNVNLPREVVHG